MNRLRVLFASMQSAGVEIRENASVAVNRLGFRFALLKAADLARYFDVADLDDYFFDLAIESSDLALIEVLDGSLYVAEPLFYRFMMQSDNLKVAATQKWVMSAVEKVCNDHVYTEAMGV